MLKLKAFLVTTAALAAIGTTSVLPLSTVAASTQSEESVNGILAKTATVLHTYQTIENTGTQKSYTNVNETYTTITYQNSFTTSTTHSDPKLYTVGSLPENLKGYAVELGGGGYTYKVTTYTVHYTLN